MTWLVKTSPHWLVLWACGCVKAQCACASGGSSLPKRMTWLARRCPEHEG